MFAAPARSPANEVLSPAAKFAIGAARKWRRPIRNGDDPELETLHDAWMDSSDPAKQKRLAVELQTEILTFAPYVPLGQYFPPTAWRSNITGQLKGPVPVFWNLQRA